METKDRLTEMAALVRADPSITVREVAHKLRYSDNKAVYYWIKKAKYKGFGDFKKHILRQQQRIQEGMWVAEDGGKQFIIEVPLRAWSRRQDTSRWIHIFWPSRTVRGVAAYLLDTNTYSPWFCAGDLLIVKAVTAAPADSWCIAKHGRSYGIGRAVDNHLLYDVWNLAPLSKSDWTVVGIIVRVSRSLSPELESDGHA